MKIARVWRQRTLLLLGLSLAVHLIGLAWLAARPALPSPLPLPRPVELVVVEVASATATPSRASGPDERPAPVRRPRAKAPGPDQAGPPTNPPSAPADAPTLAGEGLRGAMPLLLPTPSFQPPPDAPAAAGLSAPSVTKDLVGDLVKESLGRGKVDRGLVHPYFSSLGKALLKRWDPDRAVSRTGLKGFAEQFSENSKAFNKVWLDRAGTYGATGSPLPPEEFRDLGRPLNVGGDDRAFPGAPNLAARAAVQRQLREQFKSTRRATLKVVQEPSGVLRSVELVKPSNDEGVDREAVADVRAAASALPAPPPEAVGAKTELVSLWEFELVISISPPVPTFSFEFDEALRFIDARMPLDRRIYKRVKLVSVE